MDNNRVVTVKDIKDVADEIRSKAGTNGKLKWPLGFIAAIRALLVGDDCNAAAGDIRNGKTAIVNRVKVTGNIPEKTGADVIVSGREMTIPQGHYASAVQKTIGTAQAATTYNTSASDRTIATGKFTTGVQTIKAVTTENLEPGNIKQGVVVKVGDANNAGRIKNVTGTYKSTPVTRDVTNTVTASFGSIDQPGYVELNLGRTSPWSTSESDRGVLASFEAYCGDTNVDDIPGLMSGLHKVINAKDGKAYIIGNGTNSAGISFDVTKVIFTWKECQVDV